MCGRKPPPPQQVAEKASVGEGPVTEGPGGPRRCCAFYASTQGESPVGAGLRHAGRVAPETRPLSTP